MYEVKGERSLFSRRTLALIRRKALRRRVWFKDLSHIERGLVDLTVKCVEQVRSSKLTAMLRIIVERLETALRSKVERLIMKVGWPSARRMAHFAVSWGNLDAWNWASDAKFARYLTVVHINDSGRSLR